MKNERTVGGLRCSEVLDQLPDYLDRELGEPAVLQLEGHLRGCDQCARFGGRYAETVAAIREALSSDTRADVPAVFKARLRARLSS